MTWAFIDSGRPGMYFWPQEDEQAARDYMRSVRQSDGDRMRDYRLSVVEIDLSTLNPHQIARPTYFDDYSEYAEKYYQGYLRSIRKNL